MLRWFRWWIVLSLAALWLAPFSAAQSEEPSPLGDLARALRKNKPQTAPAKLVVDNDNFSKILQDAESKRMAGSTLRFWLGPGLGEGFKASSPDITCSLSFNAQGAQLADEKPPQNLPDADLPKLDGPAAIVNDSLQVSVYNGTSWSIKEITVGLTIARKPKVTAAYYGTAQLVPASASKQTIMMKRSDMTLLYHLKGTAAPLSTTVFQEQLGVTLGVDQEWHWAIVGAKGVPGPSK
jgi:hypothetical protein